MQPPKSYSIGGQRSSGQLTGKPAGAWPDHRGRWCAVSRSPWELPSTTGNRIAWTRTGDLQDIGRILHSTREPPSFKTLLLV
ncbi:UNVERIFIED_CONTAM: hypothetical protein FKN15_014042 [Acipenser sinensis]